MNLQIAAADPGPLQPEPTLFEALMDLDHKDILELGCGAAQLTRLIAEGGADRRVIALEVDRIQHELNLAIDDLPNVRFELAGAQAIPLADASMDRVFMFKSLHHVPAAVMDDALAEIARVLRPGGLLYVSEPIYDGDFNDILKLFNDEREVRRAAFAAEQRALAQGLFELQGQHFFRAPMHFDDFADFERRVLGVTHSEFDLSDDTYRQVQARFAEYAGDGGADFAQPIRVDLMRRRA